MHSAFHRFLRCLGCWLVPGLATAATFNGEIARSDFRSWSTNHAGVWIHFNQLVAGTALGQQWSNRFGVTFATTSDPTGRPLTRRVPVVTSSSYAYSEGRITVVGSPCVGCLDDRACDYEVRFVRPQRWAGLQRYWRGPTLTRFFAADGDLLHEAQGEGFHGWLSDAEDVDFWVSRIQVTTSVTEGARHVGYSDDLIFGTNAISRMLPYLSLRTIGPAVANPIPKRSFQADYRAGILGQTNDFLQITNGAGLLGAPLDRSRSTDLLFDLDKPEPGVAPKP